MPVQQHESVDTELQDFEDLPSCSTASGFEALGRWQPGVLLVAEFPGRRKGLSLHLWYIPTPLLRLSPGLGTLSFGKLRFRAEAGRSGFEVVLSGCTSGTRPACRV